MNTERLLQFHTAALAIMGTWFLAWGQESVALPAALTFAGLASLLPLRFSRYLLVNRFVANVAALAAVAWSLRDFFYRGSEAQLLAIADMLIYLQLVLLFQERTNRVYWQLLVLSVLQVVVAAALNLGPQFALLLAIYMAVAISTLVLLCFHGERHRTAPPRPAAADLPALWSGLLAAPEVAATSPASISPAIARRLFLRQVGLLTAATFLFTVVFFYSTPRLGDGAWIGSRSGGFTTTGFSTDLVLEDSGVIEPSNTLVMRVHFSRLIDRRPYPLIDEPYFHGVVLTDYRVDHEGARWVQPLPTRRPPEPMSRHINQPSSALTLVRQDITLENAHSPILFGVVPFHPLSDTPHDLKILPISSRMIRIVDDEFASHREYRYHIGTMAFHNGRQLRATPHVNANRTRWDRVLLSDELTELSEFDAERFPVVERLAEQILEEEGLTDGSRVDQILALERHFQKPGLYKYSLNLNVARHRDLDPLEDFLAYHRTGHCEYFASALAMMLRSRGIPCRIVSGYRGGEFNSLGNYFQVRQKHAHAWVEAYLSAEDTPADELAGLPSAGGSWYRLDATPAATGAAGMQPGASLSAQLGDAFDYVDLLWRDYVLGLNSSRQKDTIYDPLTNRTAGSLPDWMEADRVQSMVRKWRAENDRQRAPEERSSRSPLGIVLTLSVLGLVLAAGASTLYGVLKNRVRFAWLRGKAHTAARPQVDFYERLEQRLARLGMRRDPGQTPLEFARQAAETLRPLLRENSLAGDRADLPSLPARIVAAYYRVRFGGARLDREEVAAIEQSLGLLLQATSDTGRR